MNEEQRKQLLEDARKLVGLLEDPHPGLMTWSEFFYRTATAVHAPLDQLLKEVDG